MNFSLTEQEKEYLNDAIARYQEGERVINKGKEMKEEARNFIVDLLKADITDTRSQTYIDDSGRKITVNGTLNRNVNPSALQFFMETQHPDLKETLGRCFYPKWELSKKEWDTLSAEEQSLLIGEQVVSESIGTAKLSIK